MSTKKRIAYYMRTSHYLQQIGTQEDKIEPGWKVYKDEGVSGRIEFANRKAGAKLLEDCRNGLIERVIAIRLDRCGRSTQDILATLSILNELKIPFTSLNEGFTTLDSNGKLTPTTGLLINVLSSLSEFFYHQNREKILSGIERAKALGKYKGRQPGSVEDLAQFLSKPKVQNILELLKDDVGIRKITRVTRCSTNFVYKVKRLQIPKV